MSWFIAGFISAVAVETFLRVLKGNEKQPGHNRRVNVSMPWYGWAGAAYVATTKRRKT